MTTTAQLTTQQSCHQQFWLPQLPSYSVWTSYLVFAMYAETSSCVKELLVWLPTITLTILQSQYQPLQHVIRTLQLLPWHPAVSILTPWTITTRVHNKRSCSTVQMSMMKSFRISRQHWSVYQWTTYWSHNTTVYQWTTYWSHNTTITDSHTTVVTISITS